MKRTAQDLLQDLQLVLGIESLRTGQLVLHLHQGHLESFEAKTFVRLKPRHKQKGIESQEEVAHTT